MKPEEERRDRPGTDGAQRRGTPAEVTAPEPAETGCFELLLCHDIALVAQEGIVEGHHRSCTRLLGPTVAIMPEFPASPFEAMTAPGRERVVRHAMVKVFTMRWLILSRESKKFIRLFPFLLRHKVIVLLLLTWFLNRTHWNCNAR